MTARGSSSWACRNQYTSRVPSLCRITAIRPPSWSRSVYFTPTPGIRVSCRSKGIPLCLLDQSRGRKQPPAQQLRLLHEHDTERRRDQDVEAGERDELDLLAGRDRVVVGGELGQDHGELAVRDQRDSRIEALPGCEPAEDPCERAAGDLADQRHGDRGGEHPADLVDRADVDREAEDEEEQR